MLRRWIQAYCDWDARTHQRIVSSKTFDALILILIWMSLAVLVPVVWAVARKSGQSLTIALPTLVIVNTIVGIGATVAVRRKRQQQARTMRKEAGQCVACGYDLRESPERCPECGAANPRAV